MVGGVVGWLALIVVQGRCSHCCFFPCLIFFLFLFLSLSTFFLPLSLSSLSPPLFFSLSLFVQRPIIVSHTGVVGTCNNSRNLLDKHIERIALSGGMVSIAYFDQAVCGTSIEHIVNAIKHVRDLVGIEYVGLGSDFDGTVTVGFDTSKLNYITSYLLNDASFTKEDIRKVMGGNAIRLLKLLLPDK